MSPGLKFITGASFLAIGISYLAYLGAVSSWQYYLSVDEAVADVAHIEGKRIRVSGRVSAGTLVIADNRQQAMFVLAGDRNTLHATCRCPMPDNLTEGIDVVVEGKLEAGGIQGDKVITRCASKYQPTDASAPHMGQSAEAHPDLIVQEVH